MDVSGSLGAAQKDEEVWSPQRKKKKKDKRKDKKYKKNEKAEAESVLRPRIFGKARVGDKRQIRMPSKLQHFHKHSRVYADASITLEADDKHMEFTQTIGNLIFKAKKVDENFLSIHVRKEGRIYVRWQKFQPIWQN